MTQRSLRFQSSLCYEDPEAALEWLERAFGFETTFCLTGSDGRVVHAEMEYEGNTLMLGPGGFDGVIKSPKALGGSNTQRLHVDVRDLEAHYARAKKAGAKIRMEPGGTPYGTKTYVAIDLDGHNWTFNQFVEDVPLDDVAGNMGLGLKTGKVT
jgi:uncharacterized glyoxalase superfamily protein PhnB